MAHDQHTIMPLDLWHGVETTGDVKEYDADARPQIYEPRL